MKRKKESVSIPVRVHYDERTGKTRVLTGDAVNLWPRDVPVRITYDANVPTEVRNTLAGYLPIVLPFLPTEFHELLVGWDDDDTNSAATMRTQQSYRRCTLTICPGWLSYDTESRRRVLVHEIAHCITAPLSLLARRLIDVVAPKEDDATGPWCLALDDADESVTQDVARHLMRLIPESAWLSGG